MQKDRSRVSLLSKFNLAGWKDGFLVKLFAATSNGENTVKF